MRDCLDLMTWADEKMYIDAIPQRPRQLSHLPPGQEYEAYAIERREHHPGEETESTLVSAWDESPDDTTPPMGNPIAEGVHMKRPYWETGILRVCRDLYPIAQETFYNFNSFRFSQPDALCNFAETVQAYGHLHMVHRITLIVGITPSNLTWPWDNGASWADFFEKEADPKGYSLMPQLFPGLKELTLDFPDASWGSHTFHADGEGNETAMARIATALTNAVRAPDVIVSGLSEEGWVGLADKLKWESSHPLSKRERPQRNCVENVPQWDVMDITGANDEAPQWKAMDIAGANDEM